MWFAALIWWQCRAFPLRILDLERDPIGLKPLKYPLPRACPGVHVLERISIRLIRRCRPLTPTLSPRPRGEGGTRAKRGRVRGRHGVSRHDAASRSSMKSSDTDLAERPVE